MIKAGMTIAERYEIIEKIGTGGMSDVYRAMDHKLNRSIAVKVLKQEFSENTDFVSKFHVEAQAAAGLMHPNIVNVYDVGEEGGSHFIVMELVEGITLKKYIEKKARLSVKEAVSIAIQVAMGIEAAHNNHIIHRDIKPQNIIISKEGKVKVTDFGIAKAATSNTITSNVMGSVHYTSPEQVRGGFSDEKSDIYSLGITLFEMLTGRVPFNGETTVAVAIKHIQEPMPSPRDFVPEIPISVEQIVLKCTQKSADRRYQSAPELVEDLKKSLISPDENFVKIESEEPGGVTKNLSKKDLEAIKRQSKKSIDEKLGRTGKLAREAKEDQGGYGEPYEEEYGEPYDEYEETYEEYGDAYEEYIEEDAGQEQRKNTGNKKASARNTKKTSSGAARTENRPKDKKTDAKKADTKKTEARKSDKVKRSDAPVKKDAERRDVQARKSDAGKTSDKAANNKKKVKRRSVEDEYDPKMELLTNILIVVAAVIIGLVALFVIAKFIVPEAGSGNQGNILTPGPQAGTVKEVVMPPVEGQNVKAATDALSAAGLIASLEYEESEKVAVNQVIRTSVEAGTKIAAGSTVVLTISSGVDGVMVPGVVGLSRAEATAKLEGETFKVNVTKATSDEVEKDMVISQNPEADTRMARNGVVEIVVSSGIEMVPVIVPSVIGMGKEEALRTLSENGLSGVVTTEEYSDTIDAGKITFQNYQAKLTVNTGTEVELRVSKGLEPAYYNCQTRVEAPADYAGGDASVVMFGSDGSQLFSSTTGTFPVEIKVDNIYMVPSGTVTITYNVNRQEEVTDAEGNVTVQTVAEQTTSAPIPVNFTKVTP